MNKYKLASLSVIAGILSGLAWADRFPGLILLVSFAPFLLVEEHMFRNRKLYAATDLFIHILPGLLIFNIIALGWTRAAGIIAAVTIISGLSAVMALVFWLAHLVRLRAGTTAGVVALISFWLSFELISLHTDFLSPWMNLGNGLAKEIPFIQWYEATGVAGGTLWILISNILLASLVARSLKRKPGTGLLSVIWMTVIIIPCVISLTVYKTLKSSPTGSAEVVIVQPNSDPFKVKYSTPFSEQLGKVMRLADEASTEKTSWIIAPETLIDDPVNEDSLFTDGYVSRLRDFSILHPGADILAGMVTYREYPVKTDHLPDPSTPVPVKRENYNSAVRIDSGTTVDIYHKSRLVAGIEKEFSSSFGKFVNSIIPEYYGTGWGYSTQEKREVFSHHITRNKIAPVICYESVFGNFVADYVREGAEAIFIITNDGWWKNTIGYKQHLNFASLRAIETRRPIARAANTGISCLIDIRGNRVSETKWWEETTLKGTIGYEKRITFYVKYGDFIMNISILISLLTVIYVIFIPFISKKSLQHS